jgi:RNA recognition motif-containing protein
MRCTDKRFVAPAMLRSTMERVSIGSSDMQKLFIGNIPHNSSEGELQEWIEAAGFSVERAEIMRDRSTGQPQGFGFVLLKDEWRIKEAITALNGHKMRGRSLTVNETSPLSRMSLSMERRVNYRPD